jgi:hypothetical protein
MAFENNVHMLSIASTNPLNCTHGHFVTMKPLSITSSILSTLLLLQSSIVEPAKIFTGHCKKYDLSAFQEQDKYINEANKGINMSDMCNVPFAPPVVPEKRTLREFLKSRSSGNTSKSPSPTNTPRSSFTGLSPRHTLGKFVRDSWNSVTAIDKKSHSRSNSFDGDGESDSRRASSQRPDYLSAFVNLDSVAETSWDSLPSPKPLDRIRMDKIEKFSEKLGCLDEEFTEAVLKTLEFIGTAGFPANNLAINLAVELVEKMNEKAPLALKLLLETRFSPIFKTKENVLLEGINNRLPKQARELLSTGDLNEEILGFFFNLTHKNRNYSDSRTFDSLMLVYMQAFHNVTEIDHFLDIYAKILGVLFSIQPNKTAADVKGTIIFDEGFNEFEEKVNQLFGFNDE